MTSSQSQINSVSKNLRDAFDEKHRDAFDKKMLSCSTHDAIKLLENAYQEAQRLEPPWPQITAYRLAHLYMRSGKKTDWKKVDQLLDEASGDNNILGAMPLIYRLVSLQKLQHREPSLRNELQRIYEKAVTELKKPLPEKRDQVYLVQSYAVNLLELAVYFTGLEYQPLEGRIDLSDDSFADLGVGRSAWYVLDGEGSEEIAYPESIARQTFMQRQKECLAIEDNGNAYLPGGRFVKNAFTKKEICNWFLHLCISKEFRKKNSGRCAFNPEDEEAQRMRKKRFRDKLIELGLLDTTKHDQQFNLWWDKNKTNTNTASKSPIDVPVIMLVNPSFLNKSFTPD